MQVKFIHSIASSEGWAFRTGQIADIEDDLARKFVASGIAELPELETAIIAAPENAARRTSKAKTK